MIWLVGSHGMLGSEIAGLLESSGSSWIGTDREIDITNARTLNDFADDKRIKWILNCAAYTAVERAESETDAAVSLNVAGPGNPARIAERLGA